MRLKQLDFLRGVAILLVLGHHMRVPVEGLSPAVALPLGLWHRAGWTGVDLFFVLSGFLVSGLLFREFRERGGLGFGRFFVRRGLKIYPAFYTYLVLSIAVKLAVGHPLGGRNVVAEALFLQSYLPGMQGHTWSLAVEEHFYVLLPLVLLTLMRLRPHAPDPFGPLVAIFMVVAVAALALRLNAHAAHPAYQQEIHLYPTHLRIDALFFGVVLSYLYHFHREALEERVVRGYWMILATALMLLAPVMILPLGRGAFVQTFGFAFLYLGFGLSLLLSLCSSHELPRVARGGVQWVATIGFYSYSIYLWHRTVGSLLPTKLVASWVPGAELAAYVAASVGVGVLAARLVELPFLRLRDRKFPSRSASLTAQAAESAAEFRESTNEAGSEAARAEIRSHN